MLPSVERLTNAMPNVVAQKKFTCKGTLLRVFYLSEAPSPPMTPYPSPLTNCIRASPQRWASTLASRSNARHRSKTLTFDRKEWKIVLFWKTEGKKRALYCDRCGSRCLGIDFYTFNVKKTSCLLPLPSQRSKVVSINLPIIFFLKILNLKIFASVDAHLCFWLLASGDKGHRWDLCLSEGETCVYLSVRNSPGAGGREGVGGGGGVGGGEELPVLIETLWSLAPGLFPTLRKRVRDPTLRKFGPKDHALYHGRCWSLSITMSRDCFNAKNIVPSSPSKPFPKV